jgi:hypothetical protein
MNIGAEFQMVCGECGSLKIKIESPESASRDEIIYCGTCGTSRGTMGALRDLALSVPRASTSPSSTALSKRRKLPSQILEHFKEIQSFRRKVAGRGSLIKPTSLSHSSSGSQELEGD